MANNTGISSIRAEQLKKGMRVRLQNGWEADVTKKCDGNTLVATVFGDSTETGSIYVQDVAAAMIDGKWVNVEMTEEQSQFSEVLEQFRQQ